MALWEYAKIDLGSIPAKTTDVAVLNDLGDEGWELVSIMSNGIAYMKRQLTSSTRPNPAKRTKPVAARAETV